MNERIGEVPEATSLERDSIREKLLSDVLANWEHTSLHAALDNLLIDSDRRLHVEMWVSENQQRDVFILEGGHGQETCESVGSGATWGEALGNAIQLFEERSDEEYGD